MSRAGNPDVPGIWGGRAARGLVLACHPLPTLAVTAISAGLASLAGLSLGTGILVTLAVFTGQLSIGWSNDRIDAARDRAVHRDAKPVAAGELAIGTLTVAIGAALIATVALSLALGYRAGLIALLTVACGWAYNLGLKATALSALPYAIAFGLLPAISTLARPDHRWPAAWAVAAGALLGVAAHFANVLPDLAADAATGVRGLPHRVGARASVVIGPVLLVAATAVIVIDGAHSGVRRIDAWRWVVLGGCVGVAVAALLAGLARPSSRLFFVGTVVVALADVALFGLTGGRLT
jgi:4-hydroxybenzoate polyprenyltransferase